jgi:hypothetical protein
MAKRRTWALIALAGGTAALAYFSPRGADEASAGAAAGSTAPPGSGFTLPASLPERRSIAAPKRALFGVPPPPAPAAPPVVAEAPPAPPANPYALAGTSSQGGVLRVWLGIGNRVYEARPGEMLDETWRVQSASREAVVLLHVPLNLEQRLEAPARQGE